MEKGRRNCIIDAYRGIAIIAVMAYHYTTRWPELYGYAHAYAPAFKLGMYGVHVFFVISGLVITMTVLRSANAVEFAARRGARLYPAMITSGCTTFILMHWGPERFRTGIGDLLGSLSMDAHLLSQEFVDGAYWSLAVEVKFYVFVALSRWLLKDKFWWGLLAIAALSLMPFGPMWSYLLIEPWWAYFFLGIAGWFWVAERNRRAATILAVASVLLYAMHRPAGIDVDLLIWGVALSMLVLLWKAPGWSPAPVRALAKIGMVSYSLYLLHQYIGVALIGRMTAGGASDLLAMGAAALTLTAMAFVSYRAVEVPGNKAVMRIYRGLAESWAARRTAQARAG